MSSILKGIVGETDDAFHGESVTVLYINGKPQAKYINKDEALAALKFLAKKTPDAKLELKSEMRESEDQYSEDFNVGDDVHLGFGSKGGAGFNGKIVKFEGDNVYVSKRVPSYEGPGRGSGTKEKIYKGPIRYLSKSNDGVELDEAKGTPYVKPTVDKDGKQTGWKSSDGWHIKFWRLGDSAKAKAEAHAKVKATEPTTEGTNQFNAEKTPTVNPHAGIKDNQFRSGIGEAVNIAEAVRPNSGATYLVKNKSGQEKEFADPNSAIADNWRNSFKKQTVKQRTADMIRTANPRTSNKLDPDEVNRLYLSLLTWAGNAFPDGDPMDDFIYYAERKHWDEMKREKMLRAAVKMINPKYKSYYDYLSDMWDDFYRDNPELLSQPGQGSNPWKPIRETSAVNQNDGPGKRWYNAKPAGQLYESNKVDIVGKTIKSYTPYDEYTCTVLKIIFTDGSELVVTSVGLAGDDEGNTYSDLDLELRAATTKPTASAGLTEQPNNNRTLLNGVDAAKIMDKYRRNEASNYHTDNLVLLAKYFGDEHDQRNAKELADRQVKLGNFPEAYRGVAKDLHQRLYPILLYTENTSLSKG